MDSSLGSVGLTESLSKAGTVVSTLNIVMPMVAIYLGSICLIA